MKTSVLLKLYENLSIVETSGWQALTRWPRSHRNKRHNYVHETTGKTCNLQLYLHRCNCVIWLNNCKLKLIERSLISTRWLSVSRYLWKWDVFSWVVFRDLLFAIIIWLYHVSTSIVCAQIHMRNQPHSGIVLLVTGLLFHEICVLRCKFFFSVWFSGNGCNMVLNHIAAMTFGAICSRLDIGFIWILLKY